MGMGIFLLTIAVNLLFTSFKLVLVSRHHNNQVQGKICKASFERPLIGYHKRQSCGPDEFQEADYWLDGVRIWYQRRLSPQRGSLSHFYGIRQNT